MFTGLVQTQGELLAIQQDGAATPRRLTVHSNLPSEALQQGASIALEGCCLTIVAHSATTCTFEATTETLARTTLGHLQVGARVNLEPAMRLQDRLGGHLVSGHVDAVGEVQTLAWRQSALYVQMGVPQTLLAYISPRGSVTLAGVSLTVTEVRNASFFVALIPHTLETTTLANWQKGTQVNVEVDLMARYVARLLQFAGRVP